MKDLRQLAKDQLWATLDEKYRDFSMMSKSSFPLDEFDEKEQGVLFKLLRIVSRWGYARVFIRLAHSGDGQRIIDTAAGYGEFVDAEDCSSYIGIFIAAEAVQYPFAIDTYSIPMVRSECFRKLDQSAKMEALSLMHLASFVREINLAEELNMDIYGPVHV